STLNGFDLQALAVTGQLPAQSLAQLQAAGLGRPAMVSKSGLPVSSIVDERSIFSFDNPKTRFGDGLGHHGQQQQTQQMNLLHGVPTGMEPRQLAGLQQQLPVGNRMSIQQQIAAVRAGQNTGMMMTQPFPRGPPPPVLPSSQSSSIRQQPMLSRSGFSGRSSVPESSRVLPTSYTNLATQHSSSSMTFNNFQQELPVNSFPLPSAPGLCVPSQVRKPISSYQEEVNSSEAGFTAPSYDMFSSNRQNDWDIRSIGIAFDAHQDAESVAFSNSEAYSSSSMSRNNTASDHGRSQQQQPPPGMVSNHQVYGDRSGGSVRVKAERVATDTATMAFHDQYSNQEDLMSALLKQEGIAPVDTEFDFDAYSIDDIPV
ncbi:hypothetical protein EUTSA_v100202131mg, partial [Eutrema salsugineum]